MRFIYLVIVHLLFSCTAEGEVSDGELEILEKCLEEELQTTEELTANFVGTWELEAFGCYGCGDLSNPISTIEVNQDGTGYFSAVYEDSEDRSFTFTWEAQTQPRVRIGTEPVLYEVTYGWMCPNYIAYSGLVTDGPLIIYKKK